MHEGYEGTILKQDILKLYLEFMEELQRTNHLNIVSEQNEYNIIVKDFVCEAFRSIGSQIEEGKFPDKNRSQEIKKIVELLNIQMQVQLEKLTESMNETEKASFMKYHLNMQKELIDFAHRKISGFNLTSSITSLVKTVSLTLSGDNFLKENIDPKANQYFPVESSNLISTADITNRDENLDSSIVKKTNFMESIVKPTAKLAGKSFLGSIVTGVAGSLIVTAGTAAMPGILGASTAIAGITKLAAAVTTGTGLAFKATLGISGAGAFLTHIGGGLIGAGIIASGGWILAAAVAIAVVALITYGAYKLHKHYNPCCYGKTAYAFMKTAEEQQNSFADDHASLATLKA